MEVDVKKILWLATEITHSVTEWVDLPLHVGYDAISSKLPSTARAVMSTRLSELSELSELTVQSSLQRI